MNHEIMEQPSNKKSIHSTPKFYVNIILFLTLKHKTNQNIFIVPTRQKNVYSRFNGLIFLFKAKTCLGYCQTSMI